jgi:hypothetical protein
MAAYALAEDIRYPVGAGILTRNDTENGNSLSRTSAFALDAKASSRYMGSALP